MPSRRAVIVEPSAADALANEAIDRVAAGGPSAVEWVAETSRTG